MSAAVSSLVVPVLVVEFVHDVWEVQGSCLFAVCVGAAPWMGGSGEFAVVVPGWSEDRACATPRDADIASVLSKPDVVEVLPALSPQLGVVRAMSMRSVVVPHDGALNGSCVFTE